MYKVGKGECLCCSGVRNQKGSDAHSPTSLDSAKEADDN